MPPAPHPASEYTLRDQERMQLAGNYFNWQARMVKPHLGRRVLEIGCGVGNFTRHLLDRELVVGIDVEEACLERLHQSFPDRPNLVLRVLDVLDHVFLELKRYDLDSIVLLNVLEHVSDDASALRHMNAILAPRGKVILIIPAFESLYGPIDANLGHYRRYSKKSFRALVEAQGFQIHTLRYMNSVGFAGWWINAKVFRKTQQSESQIKWFDSKVVPILSRLESAVEPPVGQSLFAVLEKAAR
jgi:2-polyprenyl-3-methyl-5-hydroxy-6-metoxy-1,4-benzoquinol methylase